MKCLNDWSLLHSGVMQWCSVIRYLSAHPNVMFVSTAVERSEGGLQSNLFLSNLVFHFGSLRQPDRLSDPAAYLRSKQTMLTKAKNALFLFLKSNSGRSEGQRSCADIWNIFKCNGLTLGSWSIFKDVWNFSIKGINFNCGHGLKILSH